MKSNDINDKNNFKVSQNIEQGGGARWNMNGIFGSLVLFLITQPTETGIERKIRKFENQMKLMQKKIQRNARKWLPMM